MLHVSCVCLLTNFGNQFHLVVALKKTRKYFFSSTVHLENKILFNNVQTNDVEALWIFLYFKQPLENIIYVKEIKIIHVLTFCSYFVENGKFSPLFSFTYTPSMSAENLRLGNLNE